MRFILALLAIPLLAFAANDCAIDGVAVSTIGGAPVPRVSVMLMGVTTTNTRSDDNGRWSFSNVPCGRVLVNGMRAGFIQNVMARAAANVKTVVLTSGTAIHDYKLELVPQAVVTGKVTDEQGDPVMNVNVVAISARVVDGKRVFQNTNGTNTNDIGEYRLASLGAGRYVFCANPAGGMPESSGLVPAPRCYPAAPDGSSAPAVDISAGSEIRVNFNLTSVRTAHVRGVVSGAPQGVRPSLILMPAQSAGGFPHNPTMIAPDGKFDIANVRPGSYILSSDTNTGKDDFYARLPVTVGGGDVDGLSLHLEPTFEIPVTVKVESKKGLALKGTFRASLRRSGDPIPTAFRVGRTNPDGSFNFTSVTAGPAILEAFPPAPFYLKSAMYAGRDLTAGEAVISAPAPIEIVLSDDGGVVEGLVEGPDGKPASCAVMLLRNGRARFVSSDESGHFKATGMPPGDYVGYAWSDYQDAEYANPEWLRRYSGVTVSVTAGQSASVNLTEQVLPR